MQSFFNPKKSGKNNANEGKEREDMYINRQFPPKIVFLTAQFIPDTEFQFIIFLFKVGKRLGLINKIRKKTTHFAYHIIEVQKN